MRACRALLFGAALGCGGESGKPACSAECECPASAAECATLGLFNGGDFACNASARICMATARHDCPP